LRLRAARRHRGAGSGACTGRCAGFPGRDETASALRPRGRWPPALQAIWQGSPMVCCKHGRQDWIEMVPNWPASERRLTRSSRVRETLSQSTMGR
jgi:hypothetical protein